MLLGRINCTFREQKNYYLQIRETLNNLELLKYSTKPLPPKHKKKKIKNAVEF